MKRFAAIFIAICMLLGTLAAQAEPKTLRINNPDPDDRLNLRVSPDKKADSLGCYFSGVDVTVLEVIDDEWARVSIYGLEGYMMRAFLKETTGTQSNPMPVYALVLDSEDYAPQTLYAKPDTDSLSMGDFVAGTVVQVLGFSDLWATVSVNGQGGFMLRAGLSDVNPQLSDVTDTMQVCTDASVEQLNLFDAPSANAAVLGSYWNGTLVHILHTEGDWAQVRIGKLEGYMSLSYLLHLSSTASRYDLQFSFLSSEQPLRTLPDADSAASLTLPADAFVTVIGLSGSWAQIIYRGTSGFVPASALPQMVSGSWIDLLPTATPSVGFEPSSTTEPSLVSVATAKP